MYNKTIKELSFLLKKKKISATELSKIYLNRIYKSKLNAFINVNEELTLKRAKKIDDLLSENKNVNILTGIPIAHKDIFVTRYWKSTAGSRMLKNYISPFNATIVKKLNKAGTIILGKLNCDEFSMGSSNENSFFGSVKNPWNKKRISGGSSGGSAAAVAARLTPVATGTDSGGSIRQPSAFCGVTGIKPTYGSISRYGIISFASSLDQAGVIAKNAEDCSLILNNLIGFDKYDITSIKRPKENFNKYINNSLKNLKIGLPKEFFNQNLSIDIENSIYEALKIYEKLGAKLIDISLPKTELAIPIYYIISTVEASSNLLRFDGIRYGYRSKKYNNIKDMYKKSRNKGFGKEVKRRIIIGSYILSNEKNKSYYLKAQKIRRLISEDFQKNLNLKDNKCDVIMGPVSPTIAWKLKEKINKPIDNYISDIFTLSVNLAGLPGMSIPCGFSIEKKKKNPIGLQIIGNYFKESLLLNIAYKYQLNTNWHLKFPKKNYEI